jgi:hypothetical protein
MSNDYITSCRMAMKNMHQDFNVMIDAERKSKHRLSVPTVEEVFL